MRSRAAVAVGLALLLVSPQAGEGSHGPVARVVIFNPVLGEVLTAAAANTPADAGTSPSGVLAIDVHFAVVGPPSEIVNVSLVCFQTVPGYSLSALPSGLLPRCVRVHPGRHDVARINGLAAGQHTLLAEMRDGPPDAGPVRTFFTLAASDEKWDGRGHDAHKASFFLATARAGGGESSARVLAVVGSELMFQSTGSSNYGSNYPGVWFPSAGICPRSFLQAANGGRGGSFFDVLHSSAGSSQQIHKALMDPDMMFDKRFAIQYRQRMRFFATSIDETNYAQVAANLKAIYSS